MSDRSALSTATATATLARGLSPTMREGLAQYLEAPRTSHVGSATTYENRPGHSTTLALQRRGLISSGKLTPIGWQVWTYLEAQDLEPLHVQEGSRFLSTLPGGKLQAMTDVRGLYLTAARVRLYSYGGHGRAARAQELAARLEAVALEMTCPVQVPAPVIREAVQVSAQVPSRSDEQAPADMSGSERHMQGQGLTGSGSPAGEVLERVRAVGVAVGSRAGDDPTPFRVSFQRVGREHVPALVEALEHVQTCGDLEPYRLAPHGVSPDGGRYGVGGYWADLLPSAWPALEALESSALESCNGRGHSMSAWHRTDHGSGGWTSLSECATCGADVQCDTNPPPNGIDIGGPAVALDCLDPDRFGRMLGQDGEPFGGPITAEMRGQTLTTRGREHLCATCTQEADAAALGPVETDAQGRTFITLEPDWTGMRAWCRALEQTDPKTARKIAREMGSEGLPTVDFLDVRDGLPSLTVKLDGQGMPDGATMSAARLLQGLDELPNRRVTVSVRSGALKLCPDDFRVYGPAIDAIRSALSGLEG